MIKWEVKGFLFYSEDCGLEEKHLHNSELVTFIVEYLFHLKKEPTPIMLTYQH